MSSNTLLYALVGHGVHGVDTLEFILVDSEEFHLSARTESKKRSNILVNDYELDSILDLVLVVDEFQNTFTVGLHTRSIPHH